MRKIIQFMILLTGYFINGVSVGLMTLMIMEAGDLGICIDRLDVSIPCAFLCIIGCIFIIIALLIKPKKRE